MIENMPAWRTAGEVLTTMRETGVIGDQAPVDVDAIAHALGVTLRYDPTLAANAVIGQITFEHERPVVTLNPLENSYEPRRRFTLAHELGHLVLHSHHERKEFIDSQQSLSRRASFWHPVEAAANAFAAQLLMPRGLVTREGQALIDHFRATSGDRAMSADAFTQAMAERFAVSNQAMSYRLRALGVVGQKS